MGNLTISSSLFPANSGAITGSVYAKSGTHFTPGKIAAFVLLLFISLFAATDSYGQINVTQGGVAIPSATFTSLTNSFSSGTGGLFAYLNTHTITGNIVATITGNINEPGTTALTIWQESGVGGYSLTIQSDGVANRILYGATAANAPLIQINLTTVVGTHVVTITGGSGNKLTLINTNATPASTGPVLSLGGGAGLGLKTGSSVSNVNIESNATTAADGAIVIGTGTNALSISNCNISDAPSGNLSGNSGPLATGIYMSNANTVLSITGNSFYQVNTLSAALSQVAIDLVTAGSGNSITNNYIGGSAALCTGTWNNTSTGSFTGIYISAGTTSASTIGGNIIGNLSFGTGTLATGFWGINVAAGYVNVGGSSLLANTIGASAVPISFSSTITGPVKSIALASASTTGCQVSNNTISYITSAGATTIYGIFLGTVSTASATLMQANTIQNITQSYNGATAAHFYGIYSASAGSLVIGGANGTTGNGNTIQTISNASTGASNTVGIYIPGTGNSVYTINNNTITGFTSAGTGIIGGVYESNTSGSQAAASSFKNNAITAFTMSGACTFYGIYAALSWNPEPYIDTIYSNTINTITMNNTGASKFNGITVADGEFLVGGPSTGNIIGSLSSPTSIQNLGTTYLSSYTDGISVTTGLAPGTVAATSIYGNTIAGFTCPGTATGSVGNVFAGITYSGSLNNNSSLAEIVNNKIQYLFFGNLNNYGSFTGINVTAGRVNVGVRADGLTSGPNIIGDPNNVYPITVTTGAGGLPVIQMTGISLSTKDSLTSCSIKNNIIANISDTSHLAANICTFVGILLCNTDQNNLMDSVEGNTVENITLNGGGGSFLYGIYCGAYQTGGNYDIGGIVGDTIRNLYNAGASGSGSPTIAGICFGGVPGVILTTPNTHTINNNVISGINTTAKNGIMAGIFLQNTLETSATINNNTVSGLSSDTGITCYGVYLNIPCAVNVQGNSVQGVNLTARGFPTASTFTGIYVLNPTGATGPVNIGTTTGNTIGGPGANGIFQAGWSGLATAATEYDAAGIYIAGPGVVNVGSATSSIIAPAGSASPTGNTISNINATNTGNANYWNAGNISGIQSAGTGVVTIAGNSIHNLSNNVADDVYINSPFAVNGICLTAGAAGTTVTQNVIDTLIATNTSDTSYDQVGGIVVTGVASPVISQNRIYDLQNLSTATVTATAPMIAGIFLNSPTGTIQVSNNMISLGNTYMGPATNTAIYGIECGTAGSYTLDAWFNSVDIEGTSAAGALNTYAFYRGSTTAVAIGSLKNNIFNDVRARGTGNTGVGYAIYNTTASVTGWPATGVSNNNDLYVAGTGNVLGYWGAAKATLALWATASGGDAVGVSQNVLPGFVNTWTGTGSPTGTAIADLRIALPGNCSLYRDGTPVTPIVDYYNTNRNASAPDIGAYEFMDSFLLSAPATCATYGAVVTVSSTSLTTTPSYTVTYNININGSNTVTGATATMTNFAAGNPGTGTFTTSALSAGTGIITVTGIAFTTGLVCASPASESTPSFTINPLPNVSNFTTSAMAACAGTPSTITVTSSSLAAATYTVTYNLGLPDPATANTATMVFGSGSGTFSTSNLTTAGSPGITITSIQNQATGCTSTVSSGNTATITVNAIPVFSDFSASAAAICATSDAAVTVNSNTLLTGNYTVTYYVSGTNTVSSTTATMSFTAGNPGTGTFSTSPLNTAGGSNVVNITAIAYTVTPNCTTPVSSSTAAFTTNALPSAPVSGGDITICASVAPGTISASSTGNVIDWYAAASGGSALESGSNTYSTSSANTYYAQARTTSTGCVSNSRTAVTLTINANPTVYNVTGGTNCGATTVGINLTDANVFYQLWFNGNAVAGSTQTGSTPIPRTWGSETGVGTYTVVATVAATNCSATMNGDAVVEANPTVYTVGGGTNCVSSDVTLSGSTSGINYQLYNGASTVGSVVAGTGSALDFLAQTAAGTYTVIATNPVTGCTSNMSGSSTVNLNPAIYNVLGGTNCGATTITTSNSDINVGYQLYLGASTVGAPQTGVGGGQGLTWGSQTGVGIYTVVATVFATGCTSTMSGSAAVNANPTVYTVGGGTNCTSSDVTLSGSDNGINYQLYNGASTVGSVVAGTGSALDFLAQTAAGTYTVIATNPVTGCTSNMSGSSTVNLNPAIYNVLGGTNCGATTITTSNSDINVGYQLYLGAGTVGAIQTGVGGGQGLTWGSQTGVGTYTVVATVFATGCTSTMTGSAVVEANPTVYTVGGGTNCGSSDVTLSGSDNGINYQLFNGASAVGTAVAGTGSSLDFLSQTAAGTYTVVATNGTTGCTSNMNGSSTVYTNPTVYNVTGGTNCGSTTVGLSGTDVGFSYQLYLGASPVGAAINGDGTPRSFGSQTASGTYTVVATAGATSCTANMSGSAVVQTNPNVYTVGGGVNCGSSDVTLSGSDNGINYQLYNGAGAVGSAIAGNGAGIDFLTQTAAGTYTVVATDNTSGCTSNMNGSSTVYTSPTVYNVTGGANCGATTVGLSGTDAGVSYQLYNGVSTVGSPITGNGLTGSFGSQTTSGTYTVVATIGSTNCTANMNGSATVNPSVSAFASNGGPYLVNQTVQLDASGSGGDNSYSYSWSGPLFSSGNQNPTIPSATSANSGTYDVTVTDGNNCSASALTDVVIGSSVYTWNGTTSTDWTISGNWSPPSPAGGPNSCGADVNIPVTGNQPVIPTATPISVGNIQISDNAQLTLNSNLSVCKNWTGGNTSNGAVIGTGIVILNGGAAQTISGRTAFNELLLNNTSGAIMQTGSSVSVTTALDLQTGNFNANSGNLTFVSTSVTQAAIIDNFSAGYHGTLSGSINAERFYLASNTYNQHFMGSPVNAPAMAQFGASGTAGYVVPKNTCDESQMSQGSPYGTVFSYHESHGNTNNCGLAQWKVETSGSTVNGQGYSILKGGGGVITLNGTANLSSSYTLTGLTNSNWSNTSLQNRVMSSGWQLVSNPYLATLQVTTTNTGFDNQVQVWNANGPYSGSYQAYVVNDDAIIPPFQAFMVHMTNPGLGGTYTINASDRVRTPETFFAQNDNELNIVAQNIETGLIDQTLIAFNTHATDNFDPQYDADKFGGSLNRHTLYSLNNNKWMARNVLNSVSTTNTVPVGFEPGATGSYAFAFNKLSTFDPTTCIFLEDKQTGAMYNVRNGDYSFNSDSADEWNRFVIHFTPPAVIGSQNATCSDPGAINIAQPGPANWTYEITDDNNTTVASGVLNQSSPIHVAAKAGSYTLKLVDNNNYAVSKVIVVGGSVTTAVTINGPATAAAQTAVNFSSSEQGAATYSWYFSDGSIITGAANATYTFVEPGTYTVMLEVTSSTGCTSSASEAITITGVTGLSSLAKGELNLWSFRNTVYVDFSQVDKVDATIKIYNILGQEISNDKYTLNSIYQKQIDNIEAAYVVISVKNEDNITTRKLFIINDK